MEKHRAASQHDFDPDVLCTLAAKLMMELDASRSSIDVTLDSLLERDLGLDSLAKVELFARVDKTFGTALGEHVLTTAETLRDIARAVVQKSAYATAEPFLPQQQIPESHKGQPGQAVQATTLVEMLHLQAERAGDQVHLYYYPQEDTPIPVTYGELLKQATATAHGLQALHIQPGSHVALMLPTGLEYFYSFFGILLAGAVPVPLYPPARPSQIEDHVNRHRHILNNCQASLLITIQEAKSLARLLKSQVSALKQVVTFEDVQQGNTAMDAPLPQPAPEATAFLQYTSGSTGIPKGVILTHTNLLANIRAMGKAIKAEPQDVFVSWLPLYHDMGLIGAWLGSLYHGCPLVIMSPLSFLMKPARWLWLIHKHKGTLAASPNFGYEFCLNRIEDAALEGLDLRSWRMAFNGAEPVSAQTLERFAERFASFGLSPTAMTPVYGLAESSVGLAFPPRGRGPLIDTVQREEFMRNDQAIPADDSDPSPLHFVSCGQVLSEHQIRIVDRNDRELPERRVGHLQFQGPSSTSGYLRNPEKTKELFHGSWLDTGDLAYMAGQDVFLTSRVKDIIIKGGRNICPYELEEGLGSLDGVRKGCVAVFGTTDQATATERLIVLAESRRQDPADLEKLREQITNRAVDILGMPPDEVVIAPPGTVLKTSSGKIRRAASQKMYEQGKIYRSQRAPWLQIIHLSSQSLLTQMQQGLKGALSTCYACYCWLVFAMVGLPAFLGAILLPGKALCWSLARWTARTASWLTRTKIRVQGVEHLTSAKAQILVVNHQSYLDSLILVAALPIPVHFVAKAELARYRVLGFLLRKLNVIFVERFDAKQAVADSRQLQQVVTQGNTLCVFAEGTLKRMPGLLPFHMGAFVAAAENEVEIVPMAICGTRAKLRAESWYPRAGHVHLTISPPITPQGVDWNAALALRHRCRQAILQHCREPDLGSS